MNQFRLDLDATRCAQAHQDAHCGKMLLADERLMCDLLPYAHTHRNHPCAVWGMNLYEAKNLVFGCVPGAKLYPCFEEAIKRWLKLDELERQGPRQT